MQAAVSVAFAAVQAAVSGAFAAVQAAVSGASPASFAVAQAALLVLPPAFVLHAPSVLSAVFAVPACSAAASFVAADGSVVVPPVFSAVYSVVAFSAASSFSFVVIP